MLALVALAIGGALLAGCGSSGKPSYCSPVSKVENAARSPERGRIKKNGVETKTAVSQLQQAPRPP